MHADTSTASALKSELMLWQLRLQDQPVYQFQRLGSSEHIMYVWHVKHTQHICTCNTCASIACSVDYLHAGA